MNKPFLSDNIYKFLFALLGLVYFIGLFVPLMDTDSAHHADIALRMHLTGNYTDLIGHRGAYLDKPHLHFWLCALSYAVFGVTTFAYKFPSFLFIILGVYSTFQIGKRLYNAETGKLAALIIASSFAYILAGNDVRMDAILTSCIAFSIWQLIALIQDKKMIHVLLAALGLAAGFSTKGQIGVFVPAVAAFYYILYRKDWKFIISWHFFLLIVLFGLFISPVVYCYYLQYNLHPETIARGKSGINGVKFILFQQNVERFAGDLEPTAKNDYFFFLHSFLWAFAPWSIIAYIAIGTGFKKLASRKQEWVTPGVIVTTILLVSFSGFKLPHYLNIVFPTTAVLTAAFILTNRFNKKWIRILFIVSICNVVLLLLITAMINAWSFPVNNGWVIAGVVILLALLIYFFKSAAYNQHQKIVLLPVATILLAFFLLNSNFYPKLLTFQGGNQLAFATKGKVDPNNVYYWKDFYNSSYIFYTATPLKELTPQVMQNKTGPVWMIGDSRLLDEVKAEGYQLGKMYFVKEFKITRLDIKFMNPATRDAQLKTLVLVEVLGKK